MSSALERISVWQTIFPKSECTSKESTRGLFIGSVSSYAAFVLPKHRSVSYARNNNLAVTLKKIEYVTESAVYSRNRGIKQPPFEKLN
jgi:hypothetical protein